jgi:N-acetyl-anhydromuramyl-L-alanine amidase AmpD
MSRRTLVLFTSIAVFLAISACSGVQRSISANQNSRVSIVVIHHTTSNFEDSYNVLVNPTSRPVSSHYLIPEPDDPTYGKSRLEVYQLVDETRRAWHAGVSHWAGKEGINDQSIGIELVNQTWCHASETVVDPDTEKRERICFYPDYDDGQLALLVDLLGDILERHPDVKPTHIVGHSDVAPDRKIDPGPRFPWERLATLGYGAWFDDQTVIRYWERFLREPLPLINVQRALETYGYGIEPTGEADEHSRNVVRAFQLHFRPYRVTSEVDTETAAILFALIEKYYPDQLDDLLVIEEVPGVDETPLLIPPLTGG